MEYFYLYLKRIELLIVCCIVQVKLADPDVIANNSEYQKLAQSMSELEEVISNLISFF